MLLRKRRRKLFRTPRFFRLFRRNSEAVSCPGNVVVLYKNGGEFFPPLLEACREASRYICAEFYIIRDDRTGRDFADALAAAAARGVEVTLLYDYFGCIDTPGSFFRNLEKQGVRCRPFNPPAFHRGIHWLDKRDHRKIAVIDGRLAFTGGMNIGDEYAGFGECRYKWRDVGMRIEGPAVAELRRLFLESWQGEDGPPTSVTGEAALPETGADNVLIVSGGPHHNRSFIRSAFRIAIAGAAENIKIITPYFLPGPRIVRSLLRAAGRGVQVQLILPSISDVPYIRLLSRTYYGTLLKGGIEIFEREGTVLHAKVMLIDDDWAVIGSANLDNRSFHRNYEVNVIVDSPGFGNQVAAMFDTDLARSRRITLEEHEGRSRFAKFVEWLLAPLSRFL